MELYELNTDPDELTNLADDPSLLDPRLARLKRSPRIAPLPRARKLPRHIFGCP